MATVVAELGKLISQKAKQSDLDLKQQLALQNAVTAFQEQFAKDFELQKGRTTNFIHQFGKDVQAMTNAFGQKLSSLLSTAKFDIDALSSVSINLKRRMHT